MSRKKSPPVGVPSVRLRLNQNAFVHGELRKAGTEMTFSKEEAEKRMRDTQYWDFV